MSKKYIDVMTANGKPWTVVISTTKSMVNPYELEPEYEYEPEIYQLVIGKLNLENDSDIPNFEKTIKLWYPSISCAIDEAKCWVTIKKIPNWITENGATVILNSYTLTGITQLISFFVKKRGHYEYFKVPFSDLIADFRPAVKNFSLFGEFMKYDGSYSSKTGMVCPVFTEASPYINDCITTLFPYCIKVDSKYFFDTLDGLNNFVVKQQGIWNMVSFGDKESFDKATQNYELLSITGILSD